MTARIGLGCMRLTASDLIAEAIAAGVDLLDTADAYDSGGNERLVAAARQPHVMVVTKGGLERPGGAWVANGRARHLSAAARASRERLGPIDRTALPFGSAADRAQVPAIDLYLLHAIDPRTSLATSVRALAKLRDDGVVRAIGVSNVTRAQLLEALDITELAAIEIELGPWRTGAVTSGLVAECERRGITVLAHRPLGGPAGVKRIAKDPVVAAIAARHELSPVEVVLGWLRSLSPQIVTLPGATRLETIHSVVRAARCELDASARAELAEYLLGRGNATRRTTEREVVIVMGMPAAGKTTIARRFAADGYARLNRDDRGGTLRELAAELDRQLAAGANRLVLDNTYPSHATRAPVIAAAHRHGATLRCIELATSIEAAQHNACARILERHGRLLDPSELARAGEIDPRAQFRWRRAYEPPTLDEGIDEIERVEFARAPFAGTRPGVIVELDGVVWRGRPKTAHEIELVANARDALAAWHAAGYTLVGTTWLTDAAALEARLAELLALPIAIAGCSHPAGPPVCWCRKPMPGLGLALAGAHDLALDRSIVIGHSPADRGFATRLGARYVERLGPIER